MKRNLAAIAARAPAGNAMGIQLKKLTRPNDPQTASLLAPPYQSTLAPPGWRSARLTSSALVQPHVLVAISQILFGTDMSCRLVSMNLL